MSKQQATKLSVASTLLLVWTWLYGSVLRGPRIIYVLFANKSKTLSIKVLFVELFLFTENAKFNFRNTKISISNKKSVLCGFVIFLRDSTFACYWVHALARVVAQAPSIISSADIRRDLHWLSINHRISYKISLLNWKALYTAEPFYLSELISPYVPARTLRSSNTYLLSIPAGVTSHFSSRSFSVSAPSTWNSLPQHIRSIERLSTFKPQLQSHFFQSAFTV